MESGPRVFATLVEEATKPGAEHIRNRLDELNQDTSRLVAWMVQGVAEESYGKGLADGFAQGVAAECARRDREDRGEV